MSMSNAAEAAFLDLVFLGTTWDGVAQNDTTTPNTQYWMALHTADPGEAGTQATSEVAYDGYARIPVARSGAGWVRTGSAISPVDDVEFGLGAEGADSGSATYASIGMADEGATAILFSGALTPAIPFGEGIQPVVAAGSTITID